ncbi:ion channel [Rhodobacter aestuarii]|uniref:Ion channel n=1 Tax=Rhodobacter aestuarii TaxID=453582 RepID=A0A1N7LSX7_9RHOB|nr:MULTISPECIES: ion channel [Rhodobacter]PTV95059.1 ion channel [Rhodobacter aestuarii]SIS76801.1 Ion channel [Rhodobacter aestuarii]SOC07151.1 ion channel [Rhodobacter sp. JA431]
MVLQIFIGSVMILANVLAAGLAAWIMEWGFSRLHGWLLREPHRPKLLMVLLVVSLWAMGVVTVGVWLWAICFRLLGVFHTMEAAVYFSLTSYTTLGYGDVILPKDWRILGAMTGAGGFLNFGILAAMLVEALRHVRLSQLQAYRGK